MGSRTLVFAIATLYFLMDALLDLTLQNSSARRLVKPRDFKDMCSIDPVIGPPAHHIFPVYFELIYRYLNNDTRASD